MKKLLLLALAAVLMAGCGDLESSSDDSIAILGYSTVVIDSCEYVISYQVLAHKGNCRFCKERRQKELEELIIKLKEK